MHECTRVGVRRSICGFTDGREFNPPNQARHLAAILLSTNWHVVCHHPVWVGVGLGEGSLVVHSKKIQRVIHHKRTQSLASQQKFVYPLVGMLDRTRDSTW